MTRRARLLRAGQELPYRRDKIADLSLRGLAEQLGTSHRMLIHHFGSRDGFLAALLTDMRRQEQEALRELESAGTYRRALQLLEEVYLDPTRRRRLAALFYVPRPSARWPSRTRCPSSEPSAPSVFGPTCRCHCNRSPVIERAMTSCWICSVPSKMSKTLASRCIRSTGYSRV